ncbi:tetratricopeptide repeat protein [Rhizobium glycinendophyticum]|uniref:Sel1 repeat family protein n=1 Tax=Rhizobium glycinendophyticum TaxID=2589807 RepID=A0A504U8N9_9HYPH|nr:tetratricopeptide repeat protein [Rhizobium glycinendophyticum]TPP06955.1 sel1 repeat family protein [Rhizobium glycinendophyticum]
MFLGAAMTGLAQIFAVGLAILGLLQSAVAAEETDFAARFAAEQALVATLSHSTMPQDQRQLGDLYRDGLIFSADNPIRKADRNAAIAAYRRAMELGDSSPAVIVSLGRLLMRASGGQGFSAIEPALQALALEGNGDATYLLAIDAMENRHMPLEQAIPRLEAAAMLGSAGAVRDLVAAGVPVGDTLKQAVLTRLTQRAEEGQAAASLSLFHFYADGLLTDRDPHTAMKWLKQAAQNDPVGAVEQLAEQYLLGLNVESDPVRAADLFRQAARAGGRNAALALGRAAMTETNMPVSNAEARWWLQRASEANVRTASVELSNLDLKIALAFKGAPEEREKLIMAALEPIADDPDALANLADHNWHSTDSEVIGKALLPLLEKQALNGRSVAALAYNAWLEANGRPLPDAIARALIVSLRKTPFVSVGFSNFTIASLALDRRMSEAVLSRNEAIRLLFKAADDNVGQAMLRLGQLYRQGDQLARSDSFAKRWFIQASEHAVERAGWELAEMQAASRDPGERQEADRFYLGEIDAGDPRGGLAMVQAHLRQDNLDGITLERAKSAIQAPNDRIALASLLISSGIPSHLQQADTLLSGLREDELEPADLVALGRLKSATAVTPEQTAAAISMLEKAAASGSQYARTALASSYLSSVMQRDKVPAAIAMLQQILDDNPKDPEARLLLARAYMLGIGVERDARKAASLVGDVRRENGMRMPKATLLEADWLAFSSDGRNPAKAVALLNAQAARGSSAAERALGEYYLNGFGPAIRPDAAASRMYAAAHSGDKEAMAALGHMLLNGYGLSQSREAGLGWLERAANAGNTAAMYEISRVFALRPQAESDTRQAIAWLQKAAERNHPNAAYQLGLAYLTGEWVEKDVEQASIWFDRSARSGNLLAARTLKAVRDGAKAEDAAIVSDTAD